MFVGVTRQQGNGPLAHITVAYSGLGQGPRDAPFTLGGKKLLKVGESVLFLLQKAAFFLSCLCAKVFFFLLFFFQCYALFSFIMQRKHGSESVCKTKSFESFFVCEMTHRGLKCVTLVPVCHLTDKK